MIEGPDLPVRGGVAGCAARRRAQPTVVMIIVVATGASNAFGGESSVGMASGALHSCMFAEQREAGEAVIEADPGFPVIGVVAILAGSAKLADMYIILGMA